jgi:catechol 2,3-dioxygenase-like lactoylglutathione lyase family enzyme
MTLNYLLLYVADIDKSRAFYAGILGLTPIEASPTFILFILPNGMKLGLWRKDGVEPAATTPGGMEIGLPVDAKQMVDDTETAWRTDGVHIIQTATDMDFGRTFTALDPDGHRLRVFHPEG